jgi:tRNA-binding protein
LACQNTLFHQNKKTVMITWDDFEKIEMRVGTIITATPFEKAIKPAYQLTIDFGELGIKKSSAQITDLYSKNDLIGKQIIAVVNFPPKQIANFFSECLVLGVYNKDNAVVLLQTSLAVQNGDKIG